jgi:hypothetical protein
LLRLLDVHKSEYFVSMQDAKMHISSCPLTRSLYGTFLARRVGKGMWCILAAAAGGRRCTRPLHHGW